jgi:hypothetical protein
MTKVNNALQLNVGSVRFDSNRQCLVVVDGLRMPHLSIWLLRCWVTTNRPYAEPESPGRLSLDGLDFVKTIRPLFYTAYSTAQQKL